MTTNQHGFTALVLLLWACAFNLPAAQSARGPLRVHPENPRYFTDGRTNADGSLKAVYLTGSHTWNNFQDSGPDATPFNYSAFLGLLETHHHNFFRLWTRIGTGGGPPVAAPTL